MKYRLVVFLFGILLGLGCHKRVHSDPQVIRRDGYAYAKLSPTEVFIVAVDPEKLQHALEEIGCGKQYVCAIEKNGTEFLVTQTRK